MDNSGSAYVTGTTFSSDFPTVSGIPSFRSSSYDAFVAKLDPAGTALVYSTYLGGSADDAGYAIAVDRSGSAYVTGQTYSTDFPTASPLQSKIVGYCSWLSSVCPDAFVSKLNPAGTALVYSTCLGGNHYDFGRGIAVDAAGNAYVIVDTWTSIPSANPIQGAGGGLDVVVAKIDSNLSNRYRLFSDITKEHHYTTDLNEYTVLGTWGWVQEGIAHRVYTSPAPVDGVTPVPLYRLYHEGIRQHLWTSDRNEYDVLATWGWTQEGIDGYILPAEVPGVTKPLYRLAYAYLPLHLWTTDLNEYTVLPSWGWIQEGVVGHVVP